MPAEEKFITAGNFCLSVAAIDQLAIVADVPKERARAKARAMVLDWVSKPDFVPRIPMRLIELGIRQLKTDDAAAIVRKSRLVRDRELESGMGRG
jgi:hypothetical protein